jgi:hypothetical protein
MIGCRDCNKTYNVLLHEDGHKSCTTNLDIDIPFCPFCGYEIDLEEGTFDDTEMDI